MARFFYPCIDVEASGKNINQIREEREIKVTVIQEYLGLSAPQAIYKWLSGKGLPSTDHLLALSVLFKVPMEKLLVYRTIELNDSSRETARGFFYFRYLPAETALALLSFFNRRLYAFSSGIC